MLLNLLPETAEEAQVLIPSLVEKIDDDSLQSLLDDLNRIKNTIV